MLDERKGLVKQPSICLPSGFLVSIWVPLLIYGLTGEVFWFSSLNGLWFSPSRKSIIWFDFFLTFKCDFLCHLPKTFEVIYSKINFNQAEVSPLNRGSSTSNKITIIDKTCLLYSPLGIIKHIFIPGQLWFRRWVKGTSPCCLQLARKIETENNDSFDIMEML